MMSLLDDVNRLLESGLGDIVRLKQIKETLEQNKMLYVADRKYLVKLAKDHPEEQDVRTSAYGKEKQKIIPPDEDLDLEELEEKIKVESEPS